MATENNRKESSGRFFYLVCLIGFFGIFSTTISKSPVLPLLVKGGLGGNDSILGLISFFSPLAGILFSFPIGLLLDKLGFKKLMLSSAFFFVAAPLCYLFVSDPYWLIPLRFFHGVATAILGPAVATGIASLYKESKGLKLGTYSSATLVGRTIAPSVGGVIISYLLMQHFSALASYRAVYVAAFLASLPVLFLVISLKDPGPLSGSPAARFSFKDLGRALKEFVSSRAMFSTALVEMAIYFIYGILETFLPVYLSQAGWQASAIGLVFSVQIITLALSKPLFGRIADQVDKRYQIIIGLLALGLSSYAIANLHSYPAILALSIVFGLGMSLATSATSIYVADLAKDENLGSAMGALSSIMDIGQSSGPLIAGLIITASSLTSAGFLAGLAMAALVAAWFAAANFGRRAVS